jgi:hypothetical protein
MAGKRHEDDRVCRCGRAEANCAGQAARRLSHERVRELAEDIWTASTGKLLPARPAPDPAAAGPAGMLQPLDDPGYLMLHDITLPGWPRPRRRRPDRRLGGGPRRRPGQRHPDPRPAVIVRPRR